MRLSAPKKITWFISLFLGVLGTLFMFVEVKVVSTYSLWAVIIAWILLMLGTLLKGL